MEKAILNKILKENYLEIECNFRAINIPQDCEIIHRRPPVPIYHLCWVDNLAEYPLELRCMPVNQAKTPLDAIVFKGIIVEHSSQVFQAQYLVKKLKKQNIECYVRQRL